jgi:hypothetical protein
VGLQGSMGRGCYFAFHPTYPMAGYGYHLPNGTTQLILADVLQVAHIIADCRCAALHCA